MLNILIIPYALIGVLRTNSIGLLDVAFGDDASRKQKDNGAQNFSLLNRIGLNIIKNAKVSSMGVKGHRKKAGWDNDYLLYALKSFDVVKIANSIDALYLQKTTIMNIAKIGNNADRGLAFLRGLFCGLVNYC